MTVTVAMGWWPPVGDLVQRAVRSVLGQTYSDLRCVVIGDGAEPPLAIRDERLTVHTMTENHGAYFALQLALLASPHRWFAPFGADDWVEPDHLARLVAYRADAVKTGRVFWDHGEQSRVHPAFDRPPRPYEVGLFSRERLLGIGGWNPAERIGQDSLMLKLLAFNGPVQVATVPTYHRIRRPGSLTTEPATALKSIARQAMKRRNWATYRACSDLRAPDLIRAYRASLVPADIQAALAFEVDVLSARLAERMAA